MKPKTHVNSIIYYISLILPVALIAIIILLHVLAYAFSNKGPNYNSINYWLISAVTVVIYFCLFMLIPIKTYGILSLVQIYRMWNLINDGKARMTPGESIGFLFVPFYNLYWIFQVWSGFPTDYNAYLDRYGLQQRVPYLKRDLFEFFPILILLSGLIITIPVLLIVFAVLLKRTNIALDNLNSAVADVRQQVSQQPSQPVVFQPQPGFSS